MVYDLDNRLTPCGAGCASQDITPTSEYVYWTIPGSAFGHNLVTSYGSHISFTIEFDGRINNFNSMYCASISGASTTLFAMCDKVRLN